MVLVHSRAVRAGCRLNNELKLEFCKGCAGRATVFKAVRDCEGPVDHLKSRVFIKHSSSSRGCVCSQAFSPDKPPSPRQFRWENKRESCLTTSELELEEQQLVWTEADSVIFWSEAGHNNTHRWQPPLNKRCDVSCRSRVGPFMAPLCMTLRRRNDTGRSCFSAFCSRRTRDLAPIIAGDKVVQCRWIE